MRTRRYPSAPGAALFAAFVALLATSPAAPAAETASTAGPAAVRHALRFWTPQRMRRARPLNRPAPARGGLARVAASPVADGEGRGVEADSEARAEFAQVEDPTAPDFRQNGVIFFFVPGYGLGRCSGTAVDSPNRSVVVTAGHCVNFGGSRRWFNRDWVFVPGYHNGVRPFGVFPARWLGATAPWVEEGSENADVGAAVVGRNERGQRLGDAVGGYGIAFGLPPGQVFDIHGYPAEAPFDGATQRVCTGTQYLGHDLASFLWRGPLNLAVTCDVTGGASGGGWTIRGDVLNSVTNYGYEDDRRTDFGSYFGATVRALYREAARVR
jgi:V8-like Glu-specific endopeptidase